MAIAQKSQQRGIILKSFLLQRLSRLVLPLAVMMAIALLLKGHDAPGGGFVSGLALAVAGILGFTAYGLERFRQSIRLEIESVALLGAGVLLVSLLGPTLLGHAPLTQIHDQIGRGFLTVKLQSALLFDIGVVMAVGGGLSAAAQALWDVRTTQSEDS